MSLLADAAAVCVAFGLIQALLGVLLLRRFQRTAPPVPRSGLPGVSVLKPLHGAEPLLEEALETLCRQDYPLFQIVFGVQDPRDPAIAVVRRLRARFPRRDIALVVDPTRHGRNHKVANLINMRAAARHEVLVIADSDIHVAPDYLARLVGTLNEPGVGLATTLYTGVPGSESLVAALGSTGITHGFLPGALLARALGRQDCLGATMALRAETLERIGGLRALADDVADDAALGRAVRRLGLRVALAPTVPATTVPETRIASLFSHELRWARVIGAQVPAQFALSVVQYPIAWALAAILFSGGAVWSLLLTILAWAGRGLVGRAIDRALDADGAGLAPPVPMGLLPVRDLFSVAVVAASYFSRQVRWRGQALHVGVPRPDMLPIPTMSLGTERP